MAEGKEVAVGTFAHQRVAGSFGVDLDGGFEESVVGVVAVTALDHGLDERIGLDTARSDGFGAAVFVASCRRTLVGGRGLALGVVVGELEGHLRDTIGRELGRLESVFAVALIVVDLESEVSALSVEAILCVIDCPLVLVTEVELHLGHLVAGHRISGDAGLVLCVLPHVDDPSKHSHTITPGMFKVDAGVSRRSDHELK
mmetsp:Transcript_15473/g.36949  ORF Transcript_15473/g.36949 Transcript_15473/m.36949 type:complete len:200 (+) Transcript_15473:324-923(+)